MGVTRIDDWMGDFDAVLDVRSPAEFADDHVPGAISMPALSDEERARVGTLYKQVSAFEAKKVGAALISRNIASHVHRCCSAASARCPALRWSTVGALKTLR